MKLVSHSRYDNIDSELVLPVKVHSCGLPSSSVLVANSIEVSSAYVALLTHCSRSCFFVQSCFSAQHIFPQFAAITPPSGTFGNQLC